MVAGGVMVAGGGWNEAFLKKNKDPTSVRVGNKKQSVAGIIKIDPRTSEKPFGIVLMTFGVFHDTQGSLTKILNFGDFDLTRL